ncbi:MAG TPA: hypothetical protein VG603_09200 [Chitinophagales bacterium]|nr:hypothetical protein [Chitinophagales bacterium]
MAHTGVGVINMQLEGSSWVKYFLSSEYLIPFGIFVLIWAFTWLLGTYIFTFSNMAVTEKARKWILNKSILSAFDTPASDQERNEILAMAKSPKGNWVLHLYKHLTNAIPKEKMGRLKRAMQLTQDECSADFVLITRAFIVLILAFNQVSYFGWILFIALTLFLICFTVILFIGYQFAAIVPIIGYKLGHEIEENERMKRFLKSDLLKE